jgi:hypothetical protein
MEDWHMATNEPLVTIGNYSLPEPASYSGSTSSMVDTGTSVSGHLLGSMVRENVAKISLSWNYLSTEDWSAINKLFTEDFISKVRFYDQTAGGWIERDMYISERNAGMHSRGEDGKVQGWVGCSLQLTEV